MGAGVTFQVEHCVELFGTNSADIGAGSWVGNFCVLLQKRGGGKCEVNIIVNSNLFDTMNINYNIVGKYILQVHLSLFFFAFLCF